MKCRREKSRVKVLQRFFHEDRPRIIGVCLFDLGQHHRRIQRYGHDAAGDLYCAMGLDDER